MSASDHLSPTQFPVRDVMGAYSPEYDSTVRGVVQSRQLDREQVQEYARKEPGYDKPVDLGYDEEGGLMLLNGHHRAAAANRRRARTIAAYVHPLVETPEGDHEHPTFLDKLESERRERRVGVPTVKSAEPYPKWKP